MNRLGSLKRFPAASQVQGIRYLLEPIVTDCAGLICLVPVRGYHTYCNPSFSAKLAFETALKIAI